MGLHDVSGKRLHCSLVLPPLQGSMCNCTLRALACCIANLLGLQMMHDITTEGPEAERVLMTMTYTLKAAGKPDAVAQASGAAGGRRQGSNDWLTAGQGLCVPPCQCQCGWLHPAAGPEWPLRCI
jgi:hypothetical protein